MNSAVDRAIRFYVTMNLATGGYSCFGTLSADPSVCSTRGDCVAENTCVCNTTVGVGSECQIPVCYGVPGNETTSCTPNGFCMTPDICQCMPGTGWSGPACGTYTCSADFVDRCSGHGTCGGGPTGDACTCLTGWGGDAACSTYECSELSNCSGHGQCIGPNNCSCEFDWTISEDCSVEKDPDPPVIGPGGIDPDIADGSTVIIVGAVVGSLVGVVGMILLVVLVATVVCCCVRLKRRKEQQENKRRSEMSEMSEAVVSSSTATPSTVVSIGGGTTTATTTTVPVPVSDFQDFNMVPGGRTAFGGGATFDTASPTAQTMQDRWAGAGASMVPVSDPAVDPQDLQSIPNYSNPDADAAMALSYRAGVTPGVPQTPGQQQTEVAVPGLKTEVSLGFLAAMESGQEPGQ